MKRSSGRKMVQFLSISIQLKTRWTLNIYGFLHLIIVLAK